MPPAKYPRPDVRVALLKQIEEKLLALPGVTHFGTTSQLPLTGSGSLSPYAYNDETARTWESETSDGRAVSADYFRAMGTRLKAGRFFDERDYSAPPNRRGIIIDETLAARAWPGENPVGKQLQVQPTGSENAFAEVIGVVEHTRVHDLSRAVRPQLYRAFVGGGRFSIAVRASVDPASLVPQVRQVIAGLDPDLPIDRIRPMASYVADGLAHSRLNFILMSFFGGAALLLSCVGIYGVFSYSVGQRTREIGIRMALGQDARSVRNLVLLEGVRLTLVSTALGVLVSAVLARSVASLLFGVNAGDPATFATMTVVLMGVALAACYVPARRATMVNPLIALKTD